MIRLAERCRRLRPVVLAAAGLLVTSAAAAADSFPGLMGGGGGGRFQARCPPARVLAGIEVRAGDDIDAIRPVCVSAYGEAHTSPVIVTAGQLDRYWYGDIVVPLRDPGLLADLGDRRWHGGGGGALAYLVCPLGIEQRPVVVGLGTIAGGENTIVVFNIRLVCGRATAARLNEYSTVIFDAEGMQRAGAGKEGRKRNQLQQQQGCPPGQVAVGIEGRSGIWLDALGLICGEPTIVAAPPTTVGSIGKVKDPRPISTTTTEASPRAALRVARPGVSESASEVRPASALTPPRPLPPSPASASAVVPAARSAFGR